MLIIIRVLVLPFCFRLGLFAVHCVICRIPFPWIIHLLASLVINVQGVCDLLTVDQTKLSAMLTQAKTHEQVLQTLVFCILTTQLACRTPCPLAKLARRTMTVQEMDFHVLHKSGKTHMNANALSRNVQTTECPES